LKWRQTGLLNNFNNKRGGIIVRIGVSARFFDKYMPVDQLAKKVSDMGFDCIQITLPNTLSSIDTGLGRLNPGMANYIGETFRKHGVQIAVLECYINPIHPDETERKRQIAMFKERIRYAREFGTSVVATETGSLNTNFTFHPENHSEKTLGVLLRSLDEMVNEAEKFGIMVCIEGVKSFVAHSPQRIRRILDEIDSVNLQVLFDPVNLLSIENYKDQDKVIKDSFDLFGDNIIVVHAKDFQVKDGQFKLVQSGKGMLNYELLFKLLKERKPYINVIMEDIELDIAHEGISYLRSVYDKV